MRKYPLRRNKIKFYRFMILTGFTIALVILIKTISFFASDSLSGAIHKFGAYCFGNLYVRASCQNQLFDYAVNDLTGDSSIFTALADGISINYYAVHEGRLTVQETKEYEDENIFVDEETLYAVLEHFRTNNLSMSDDAYITQSPTEVLEIQYEAGNVEKLPEHEETDSLIVNEDTVSVFNYLQSQYSIETLSDLSYLMSNFYIVDSSTSVTRELFDVPNLLSMDLSIDKSTEEPQILIYHTHASETYADSKKGVTADTVVGPGNYLTTLLEGYGYCVYHDTTAYDRLPNGEDNRNYAYSTARPNIEKIIADHPSIQVVIDLHRDDGEKRVTTINGKETARIMLFNGLCRNQNGPLENLPNNNLETNLAMSLQTALVGRKFYDGLIFKNYLKNYRYNMHLMGRYLLVELGTDKNTVMEAYNAMEPFAVLLDQVLRNRVEE